MKTQTIASAEGLVQTRDAKWMRVGVNMHHRLSAYLVEETDLHGAFRHVLADLCQTMGWAFGEAWMPDDAGSALHCIAWHARDPSEDSVYGHALPHMRLGKGNGPAGRAWQTGQVVWLRDVEQDPSFVNPDFVRRFGLKAGLGVPVLDGNHVTAVLVFFLKSPAEKDEHAVELVGNVAVHLGLFVRAKQTSDLLEQRERQLADAQQLCRVGSWSWDLRADRMQWSDQLYRNLRLEPQSLTPSVPLFLKQIHEDDRAFLQERVRLLRQGAPPLAFHRVRSIPCEGSAFVLEIRVQVEKDASGTVVCLLGTVQDVTPQVEAEEALQRQGALLEERVQRRTAALRAANELLEAEILERRKAEATLGQWTHLLREVLQAADELISCTTQDSFYRRAVELPRERLGLERAGLLVVQEDELFGTYGTDACGRTVDERHLIFGIPLYDSDNWASRLGSIRDGGKRWHLKNVASYPQYTGIELDGEPPGGWVAITAIVHEGALLGFYSNDTALSGKPVDPIQQEVLAVYCTLLGSLMKSRTMALQLASEEQRLRLMVENLPAGAVYVGREELRINRRAEEIIGYSRDEVDSLDKWFPALYGAHAEAIRAIYENDLRNGFPHPTVVPLRRKDGQDRQVAFHGYSREGIEIWLLQDVTDRAAAEGQICQYQSQLRSLATEIGLAEERQRRRIAAGLHDQVVQMLALAKIRLGSFISQHGEGEAQKNALQDIRKVIDSAIQETRALTFDLSPPVLYELGLGPALEWLAERTQRKQGMPCSVYWKPDRLPLPIDHAVVLFQAVRELINNVVKHACAAQIEIRIAADQKAVRLCVQDDGLGFDPAKLEVTTQQEDHHFGLFNIRERIHQLGGQVEIDSRPGQGCRIELIVPAIQEEVEEEREAP